MQREELLKLLRDPVVCQEIFLIMKNGGRPLDSGTAAPAKAPASAAPSSDTDKLSAIRSKLQQASTAKKDTEKDKLAAIKDMLKKKQPEEPKPSQALSEALAVMDSLSKEISPEKGLDMSKVKDEDEDDVSGVPSSVSGSFGDKLAFLRNHVQKTNEERAAQAKAEAEKKASNTGSTEQYTFILERPCPVCGMNTHVVKCKSRLIVEKTDLDLCIHYKGINPYLYRVWACEHCGYAADEQKFTRHMPEKTQEKLLQFLQTANLAMPFTEERTSEQAVAYLEMAILFNELSDPSPNRRANLYLIMAWIHRYDGNAEKEREALDKAAELFDLSLDTENYPVDKMSDTMATYLTGAIHVLRQDYDKATRHLSRIISNQNLRTSAPKLFEMARDMWQDIKNTKKA